MELVKPFIKWAGGKGSLISQMTAFYPMELKNGSIEQYIEPFVGGGAALIDILQKYEIKQAYAFDINQDLINCYQVIKTKVNPLIYELAQKEKEYLALEIEQREAYFYQVRKHYNSYSLSKNTLDVTRASEFIFLNKTCFNGLYRVNKKGEFNVPFGKYKNPTICDTKNLEKVSELIQKVNFQCGDYQKSEAYVNGKTFVYFDPPYRPLSATSSFTSYTKEDFNDENQKDLANYVRKLDALGAKLMVSNSNPKQINQKDTFFEEIYQGFQIHEIIAKRMINSIGKRRGEITELVITNYHTIKQS